MNIRRKVDYSALYAALDSLLERELLQMDLYREIGCQISASLEKGAAVAAAGYLRAIRPDYSGFSPRNVRRMRDFYRADENDPDLMDEARELRWTQNVLIFEGCKTAEERVWYLLATRLLGWSKQALTQAIADRAHIDLILDERTALCYTEEKTSTAGIKMTRILFVCHGNICRSPMAEFVMKRLVEEAGQENFFEISSTATSSEELGNPVYPPARCKLAEHGIDCAGKVARQLQNTDYDRYDLLIGMDSANVRNILRICGGDFSGKVSRLLDHTDRPGDIADPWYTEDFEQTWRDVERGCRALLEKI